MFEFFALLGGFWFFMFVIAVVCIGIIATEVGSSLLGTVTFVLALLGMEYLFDIPIFDTVLDNPLVLVGLFLVYTIVGSIYTLLWRWPEFLRENKNDILDAYEYKRKQSKTEPFTFEDYVTSYDYKYSAKRFVDPIIAWIVTWPFSLVWELARKPVKFVSSQAYQLTSTAFEKIGMRTVKGILEKK